jgi:hypothetical protein
LISAFLEQANQMALTGSTEAYDGNLIQPTIFLEMPVPSQGHYGFHSFPVVD